MINPEHYKGCIPPILILMVVNFVTFAVPNFDTNLLVRLVAFVRTVCALHTLLYAFRPPFFTFMLYSIAVET